MSILSGLLNMVPVVGPLLSGLAEGSGTAAKGAATGRQLDTQNQLSQAQLQNQQYNTQQNAQMQAGNLDISQKQFEEQARGDRAKQAAVASLLGGGYQPVSVTVPGVKSATVSGGLANSLTTPGMQQSMQQLMQQALAAQMTQGQPGGDTFTGGQILAPPTLAALPKPGALESALGGVGLGSSLLSSILPALAGLSKKTPAFPTDTGDYDGAS